MVQLDTPDGYSSYQPVDSSERQALLEPLPTPYWSAEDAAVEWLRWLRDSRERSPQTLRTYAHCLRQWLTYCDTKHVDPLRPTEEDVEAFLKRIRPRTRRKGSASSQQLDLNTLRGWYRWLERRRRVPERTFDVFEEVHAPTRKRQDAKPIPDVDWRVIWCSPLPDRLRVALGFGYFCGLRRDEIVSLSSGQVTDTQIVRFTRKGGGQDTLPWLSMATTIHRKLPGVLPDLDIFRLAVDRVTRAHEKLTIWSDGGSFYKRMVRLCDQLGIDSYTPHQLRHSAATNLLRAKVPEHMVMRLMNHSSFDITMGYVRAGAQELNEWMKIHLMDNERALDL